MAAGPRRSGARAVPATTSSSTGMSGRPHAPRPSCGRGLRLGGGYAESRDQLPAALEVLRADPEHRRRAGPGTTRAGGGSSGLVQGGWSFGRGVGRPGDRRRRWTACGPAASPARSTSAVPRGQGERVLPRRGAARQAPPITWKLGRVLFEPGGDAGHHEPSRSGGGRSASTAPTCAGAAGQAAGSRGRCSVFVQSVADARRSGRA